MSSVSVLQPYDLGLILSYQCQSACAHCLYNCVPRWQDWISAEMVEQALEATAFWRQPYQIHITGEEPFLNYPILLHAVSTAHKMNIPVYLETNAGWCVSEDAVSRRFSELQRAGLQAILISCSPFHAATIPPERTLLAIRIAFEVFSPSQVIIYQYEWLKEIIRFGEDKPIPLQSYIKQHGEKQAGNLFWRGYGLISGGRSAYSLGHLTDKNPPEFFSNENCQQEMLYAPHSHFDLYSNYIPGFCGGISIGTWRELPRITSNFRSGNYPPLVAILIQSGPFGLFQMANREFGYVPKAEGYVGKCHLCVDLRKHLIKSALFNELQPSGFYT